MSRIMTDSHQTTDSNRPNNADHAWSEKEIAELRELATTGQTAGQISQSFPGKSRNAILGKLYRLKIHIRTSRWYGGGSFWENVDNIKKLRDLYYSPLGYSLPEIGAALGCAATTLRRGIATMKTQDGNA